MYKYCLILPFTLLLTGCGPSVEKVAETRSAEIKPILEQIDKAGTAALGNKEAPADITLPEGDKLAFQSGADMGNAFLIQAETFDKSANEDAPSLDLVISLEWLENLRRVYAGDIEDHETPKNFEWNCDKAASMKYVVVVRANAFQAARIVDDMSYEAGEWTADLLLYELSSGKCLGSIEVKAASSESVYADGVSTTEELETDLRNNARDAVEAALKPHSETAVFN